MVNIADLRKEYKKQTLSEKDVIKDPFLQFDKWWKEALESEIDEVNAMTLATSTTAGIPSARIVLLKEYNNEGFVFYTNYNSIKGRELNENPNASLVFFWAVLERQVRITGKVEKTSSAVSNAYFASRPIDSRIGAWASPQSDIIANREILEQEMEKYKNQFHGENIPRPPYWGGYILKPFLVEFWQGRPGRLHDRIQYTLQKENNWKIERLAP